MYYCVQCVHMCVVVRTSHTSVRGAWTCVNVHAWPRAPHAPGPASVWLQEVRTTLFVAHFLAAGVVVHGTAQWRGSEHVTVSHQCLSGST